MLHDPWGEMWDMPAPTEQEVRHWVRDELSDSVKQYSDNALQISRERYRSIRLFNIWAAIFAIATSLAHIVASAPEKPTLLQQCMAACKGGNFTWTDEYRPYQNGAAVPAKCVCQVTEEDKRGAQ